MKVYSFQNSDEELLKASSGGAFYAIASSYNSIINSPGFFGSAFDESFNVVHKYVTSLEHARIFQGSKYVRSDIQKCYEEVKEFLLEDRGVLFSGTPCQIAGLVKYLKNNKISTEKLLTIQVKYDEHFSHVSHCFINIWFGNCSISVFMGRKILIIDEIIKQKKGGKSAYLLLVCSPGCRGSLFCSG